MFTPLCCHRFLVGAIQLFYNLVRKGKAISEVHIYNFVKEGQGHQQSSYLQPCKGSQGDCKVHMNNLLREGQGHQQNFNLVKEGQGRGSYLQCFYVMLFVILDIVCQLFI